MGTESDPLAWPSNYFNYFTEIEERFQRARGTALFLLSPLDWALVETWKNAGVPLEAALRGIDAAFEKWRTKKTKIQNVNSLAYCAQAVLVEAQAMAGLTGPVPVSPKHVEAPFTLKELKSYMARNIEDIAKVPGYEAIVSALERAAGDCETLYHDLEQMEQRLTSIEEKMIAIARTHQSEESLFGFRRDLEHQLRPYRSKMAAEQLVLLEKQYLERNLLEAANLPRLSLFYLR